MAAQNIDPYFWTWSIPYNADYQNEWSFEHVMLDL